MCAGSRYYVGATVTIVAPADDSIPVGAVGSVLAVDDLISVELGERLVHVLPSELRLGTDEEDEAEAMRRAALAAACAQSGPRMNMHRTDGAFAFMRRVDRLGHQP